MKIAVSKMLLLFLSIFTLITNLAFAQERRAEQEDKLLKGAELKKPLVRPPQYKLSMRADIFTGYDSNPSLDNTRKGDIFEETRLFLDFRKTVLKDLTLSFDYYLDSLMYNQASDSSSILNNVRLGIHKRFLPFRAGGGYNLSFAYYPRNEDGDFLFHKWFTYLGHDVMKKLYHQLQFEGGVKDYVYKKALLDTILLYQDNQRRDKRLSAEYLIGFMPDKRLLIKLRSKYSLNDSNAVYLDFYDYYSLQETVNFDYRLFENVSLITDFSYTRTNYDSRIVTEGDSEQEDDLYVAGAGLIYRLDINSALSLYYTYRDNASNDSLAEYCEHVITCGWQHKF